MKLTEVLKKGKFAVSFEVFPPKDNTAFESVRSACERIAALKPSYVSVTYGAGGGTSEYTLDIAESVKRDYGVPALAHLTCISSTKSTVSGIIARMRAAGIENVLALRGDIPSGGEATPRDYRHAAELVSELRGSGADFCIGAACYPEVHPESKNQADDIRYLKAKVDSGVDFLTTQMFFDNSLFYSFKEKASDAGIFVPIVPGIMPITSMRQIERVEFLSGSYMPKEFIDMVEKYGSDDAAMKQAGIDYAASQIRDLYENGVKNVHVYTMNNPEVAKRILSCLSDILGK